jgi:short-subunit dehydrogenase involved in D-alanine esterification of teichoic acids
VIRKFGTMLSLTTMLALSTFQRMKLTENPILVTGIGRARAEAFHAFGNQVMIVGRRKPVLDQTTDADPGIASVSLDERSSACASL